MILVRSVAVTAHPAARLEAVVGGERYARLAEGAGRFRTRLAGRTVWNVSSTAVGGGVAEFFAITKRLHNQIHGQAAGGPLSGDDARHYERMLAANGTELLGQISRGDLVLLHDPTKEPYRPSWPP